ncbi:TRAP transporter substrate-binding protein [Microbaculum marinisediminis]|uniref:TRAP transporter substrate-binding protein n=1 Tax=Microbaculum marinisediminis TaxID=2931392 RepID=A0AAW5QXA1_9HYPH|nr:TRAP transporter substrate-binding protein [Microbaculum sp. A6E488]MCT8971607.1 TRAP transporter substrate-binding protein [Microbaculum sp. A6E488]
MDRRSFLKKAGIGSAAAASAAAASFPTPAISQGTMELKMVTTWPKNFPGLGTGAQRAADRITALTDGRITVKVFAAGELVPPFESFDAVSQGTADMYHAADYYWLGKHTAYAFFCAVPLGMTYAEQSAWIAYGGGQELWDELGAGFNIKSLLCGNTGTQMAGWFKNEVKSLEDLKGLKFRMPGLGGELMRQIGVNVINLPGGEIFPALQSGAIDGADWVGPWNDLAFGFYKVAKNYYYPNMSEGGAAIGLGINKGVWDKLSPTDQEIFKSAAAAENSQFYADFNANNAKSLNTLINEHGVKVSHFPDDIIDALGKAAPDVLASAATDDIGKRIHDAYLKSRDDYRGWSQVAEPAYVRDRARVLGS